MANTLKVKRSAVPGKVPAVTDLELGELAINTYDGKLFLKKDVNGTAQIVDVSAGVTAQGILNLIKLVDGAGSGLDADLLNGQQASYYLDWANVTNKPDPVITVTLTGDVTGSGNATLTDLASGAISFATTIAPNSVALGTDTTGNYVAGLTAGTGIAVTGTAGEGWSPTVALASAGTAGTYSKVTTDAYGRVTSGTTLAASDIPALDASKITSGTIDAARLPSYVDDVLEFTNLASFPSTGEAGKIYVALDTNKTYRWSGSAYVYITSGAVDSVNAGNAITVSSTTGVVTVNHADTSSQASVDNSGNTFIQDITLDTYGHITGIASATVALGDGTLTVNTSGTGLSGSGTFTANQSTNNTITITSNATSANTASTVVARDASGNFSAGTITAALSGNASSATILSSVDDRDMKPNTSGINGSKAVKTFFSSLEGMTGAAGTDYQDVIVFDTYSDASGGNANALTFDKSEIAIRAWQAGQSATSWGTSQRIFMDNYHPNADTWTTGRTLTMGSTGKLVDGSANVSWTLAEIGAASATHTHTDATTSAAGFMSSADKTKLEGVATGANNYSHPTGDGNLHVPATGTTNNGKVLKAGSTAGDLSWGTLTASDVGAATSSHNHDASYPTLAAFNALVDRVTALEDVLGDIQSALDAINGV